MIPLLGRLLHAVEYWAVTIFFNKRTPFSFYTSHAANPGKGGARTNMKKYHLMSSTCAYGLGWEKNCLLLKVTSRVILKDMNWVMPLINNKCVILRLWRRTVGELPHAKSESSLLCQISAFANMVLIFWAINTQKYLWPFTFLTMQVVPSLTTWFLFLYLNHTLIFHQSSLANLVNVTKCFFKMFVPF